MADKKKRGESGKRNAETSPFRLNGLPMDWAARRVGALNGAPTSHSGSTLVRGVHGGMVVEALMGSPMRASTLLMERYGEACERAPIAEKGFI